MRPSVKTRLFALGCLTSLATVAAEPGAGSTPDTAIPTVAAFTEQPRTFGHVLGDVLSQRVLLEHSGRVLEIVALPPADRVDRWFERRTPRIETASEGQRWLVIDYQLINAPRMLTAAALPSLTMATTAGTVLVVPALPVSIGPLTLDEATVQNGALALQPDRPVVPHPTNLIERQLQNALIALTLVLITWLAWWAWRHLSETERLPFARSWRHLRRLDLADPAAWMVLHHAINQTAGRVVHAASLPRLLDDVPHLRPLQPELERFFRASNARFFGITAEAAAFPLRELGLALRAAERRHHR
jgi:mxaA protein